MRRRNKPRVVWLPQTNANSLGAVGELTDTVFQLEVFSATGPTGSTNAVEIPLVLDAQKSFFDTDVSLADIESSGYRLRRVVGKIWIQAGQSSPVGNLNTPVSAIVTAGIIVRQTDIITGGSKAAFTRNADLNPALIENTGDPWVWRRSWLVGNNFASSNVSTDGFTNVVVDAQAQNNYLNYAGGNADAAHVDQKTARLVGAEQRLFLDVSATVLSEANPQPEAAPLTIAVITDLRVLGSLRTTVGNRRNASR